MEKFEKILKTKMDKEIKVKVKIVDKRYKDGWFGRSYYAVLYFSTLKPSHVEIPISLNNYYQIEVGEEYEITMILSSDNPGKYSVKYKS